MKKLYTVLTALILILPALSGCMKRDVDFTEPEGLQTPNSIWLAYDDLNDAKEYTVTFAEPTEINAEITTSGGSLWIKIVGKDGTAVYEETVSEKKSFTVNIRDAGEYRFILKGHKHTGGFLFTW